MRRRGLPILAGLLTLGLAAGGLMWAVRPAPVPPPVWGAEYDLAARSPEEIAPGTVIDWSAPPGWSHLVIKSLPRVKPGEEAKVPSNLVLGRAGTVRMAGWMFTAFLADVISEPHAGRTRHRLRAVGLGLGTSANGKDTVITPETAKQFGVEMNWITSEILTTGYAVQRQARMVIHGPSFGLMDTPVWFRGGESNRLVRYRYALLVDDATGRLSVLLWSLGADGGPCGDLTTMVAVGPDTIDTAELVVDPAAFSKLGIPSEAAFAVEQLPPGRRLPLPPELRPLAAQTRFTAEEARELERRLREIAGP